MRRKIYSTKKIIASTEDELTEEFKNDVEYAICWVNDSDRSWRYNTPELFTDAVFNYMEDHMGYKHTLTDAQSDYIIDQASRGDFGEYDEDGFIPMSDYDRW